MLSLRRSRGLSKELARIYKRRMIPIWKSGLNPFERGRFQAGRHRMMKGIELLNNRLNLYDKAIQKEPFSPWISYAIKDLDTEQTFLDRLDSDLLSLNNIPFELNSLMALLKERLTIIREKFE